MEFIESRIDTTSEEFKANREHMEQLVEELRAELKKAREDRSEKARKRNEQLGKLTVQQRLDKLLDRNTPWLEIAPLAAKGMYDSKVHGAGTRAGIGLVNGREVLVHANDPMIKGGTVYPMGVKKTVRCQTIAMENNLPDHHARRFGRSVFAAPVRDLSRSRTTAAASSTTRRSCRK